MATSSSTSPRVVLEGMKEEDEQTNEPVSGLMEVDISHGLLGSFFMLISCGNYRLSKRVFYGRNLSFVTVGRYVERTVVKKDTFNAVKSTTSNLLTFLT